MFFFTKIHVNHYSSLFCKVLYVNSKNITTNLSAYTEKRQVQILLFSYCAPVSQICNTHYGSWVILKNSTVLSNTY